MKSFSFERPATAQAAAAALAINAHAKFIAGGTNLLDLMKLEIEAPTHLIDINRLGLDQIETTEDGGVRIGAMVRNSDLAAHSRIRTDYAVLSRALLSGASGQLRNMATTGGNLLQRTRCYYFYDTTRPCNKRVAGSGCSAVDGFNRMHAILGASDQCVAVHPSDMAVAMRLLDAEVETINSAGARRVIPIADFHRLPATTPHIETNLRPDEMITGVKLPAPLPGRQTYRKVRDRASYAFAIISVAVVIDASGERAQSARFALGGVAHKPWRVETAELSLSGTPINRKSIDAVIDQLLAGARGYGHNDFKLALVRRTLHAAVAENLKGSPLWR